MEIRRGSPDQNDTLRALIEEYAALIGEDCCGLQEFAGGNFPSPFVPPTGDYLLAFSDGAPVGCVAYKRIDADICELKRLFVRPSYQGCGIGRALVETIMEMARGVGYRRMRLDTHISMASAIRIYERLGFEESEAFHDDFDGARFMARDL